MHFGKRSERYARGAPKDFSVAQSQGDHPIRSQLFPRGIPGLKTDLQRERIEEGKSILDGVIGIIRILNVFNIGWVIENSFSSYLFHGKLMDVCRGAIEISVHQCFFGARWRKHTRIWIQQGR